MHNIFPAARRLLGGVFSRILSLLRRAYVDKVDMVATVNDTALSAIRTSDEIWAQCLVRLQLARAIHIYPATLQVYQGWRIGQAFSQLFQGKSTLSTSRGQVDQAC